MLMLLGLITFTSSLIIGVPAKNAIAIPEWLQLATALNLRKTCGILIYLRSMVKNRKFLGRSGSCFPSARCNIHNT
jgi:hypothetical protein